MAEAPPPPGDGLRIPFRARSRVVAGAKVLLPLLALLLLSTVFLVARAPGEGGAIPFARLAEIAREPRLERPRLAGVADDGTAVRLSADRLRPLPGRADAFAVEAPLLETEAPGGQALRLRAAGGEVDAAAQVLRLAGGVTLEAALGYRAEAPGVTADLRTGRVVAEGGVEARAPFGRLTAGALEAGPGGAGDTGDTGDTGEARTARLVFTGGVRLLYVPPPPPEAP